MAIFWSDRGAARGPSLTGRVIIDTYNGKRRARAWPRHKKRRRTQAEKAREEWFAHANRMDRYAAPLDKYVRREATRGTVWMPRDPLVKQLAGQLIEPIDTNGQRYRAMSLRRQASEALDYITDKTGQIAVRRGDMWEGTDAQTLIREQPLLDRIASAPGDLLLRTEDGWVPLRKGNANQALIIDKDTLLPTWKEIETGGGGDDNDKQSITTTDPESTDLPLAWNAENLTIAKPTGEPLQMNYPENDQPIDLGGFLRKAPHSNWTATLTMRWNEKGYNHGYIVQSSATGQSLYFGPHEYFGSLRHRLYPVGPLGNMGNHIASKEIGWTWNPHYMKAEISADRLKLHFGNSIDNLWTLYDQPHGTDIPKPDRVGFAISNPWGSPPWSPLEILFISVQPL